MLSLYAQLIIKQGIRAPLYLTNPAIVHQDELQVPRFSVLHAISLNDSSLYVDRESYYFKEIPPTKKIPVKNVLDLTSKEDTTLLNNKYLASDTRKWVKANITKFVSREVTEEVNADANLLPVINYNTIKDLYSYKASVVSEFHKQRNLSLTYWDGVKEAVSKLGDTKHLIPFELPDALPSFDLIKRIMTLKPNAYIKVVGDAKLFWFMELYKWLGNETRPLSTMSQLTDEDAAKVLIELKYKGYSTYLPLDVLRGISEESALPSKLKVDQVRVNKMCLKLVRIIQDRVTALIEGNLDEETLKEELADTSNQSDETEGQGEEVDTDRPAAIVPNELKTNQLFANKYKDRKTDLDAIDEADLDLSSMLNEEEEIDSFVEAMFNESISKAERPIAISGLTAKKVHALSTGSKEDPVEEAESADAPILHFDDTHLAELLQSKTPTKITEEFLNKAATEKTLTAAELRALRKIQTERVQLKSPYNNETIDSFRRSKPKDIKLTSDNSGLEIKVDAFNEDMKSNKIQSFDKVYLENILEKDIVDCVLNLEKADIIVRNYEREDTVNITDRFETHKVTFKPLGGKESICYFRIPKVDEDGTFMVSGREYRMRKLRQPLPIVKVGPTRVALTSNYSKVFISRTERKTNDRDSYITSFIRKDYLGEKSVIKALGPTRRDLTKGDMPYDYRLLGSNFKSIRLTNLTLLFDQEAAVNHVEADVLKGIEKKGLFFCGYTEKSEILVMNDSNAILNYSLMLKGDNGYVGTVEEILDLDTEKVPKPFTSMRVLGDDIPLGVCLSYYLGLSGLIAVTKTHYQLKGAREQHKPAKNELILRFSDHKLILTVDTVEKQLLFNGFLHYKDTTKQHTLRDFSDKNVYLNLLEQRGSRLIHLKELKNLNDLFLDPITINVLEGMGEPTDYIPLLLRANELLKDKKAPDMNDPDYVRIRGYDRIPGLMYRALAESVREYRIKGRSNGKIAVDPYKVWNYITQDSSVKSRDTVNPVLSLKEDEAVTLAGADGLSPDAINATLRRYHPNDLGLISEATVDSRDVAVTTYLSPYAKLDGVRGRVDAGVDEVDNNGGKAFSTSILLAPFSEYDDAKRIGMVSIQNAHTIPAKSYTQPVVRTGHETIMPYKVAKQFCVTSKEDGTVIAKTDNLITIKYKSGKVEAYEIGVVYGEMEGGKFSHDLITTLKVNDKVKKSAPIAYHKDFFEPDWVDPSKLIMKFSVPATIAIIINNEVFEDSTAISSKFAEKLSTERIKDRTFILNFNDNLLNMVTVGTEVKPNDILFTGLDETSEGSNLSEQTVSMLQNISSLSPRAKVDGVIDRIEVRYNGDVADMSPSVRKLVSKLDREVQERTKGTKYEVKSNKVTSEYRSSGKNLELDTFELKIYIKSNLRMSVGDKSVYGGQLKHTVSDVFNYTVTTESLDEIDGMFSFIGILNRVVSSPLLIGTISRTTRKFNAQVVSAYFD